MNTEATGQRHELSNFALSWWPRVKRHVLPPASFLLVGLAWHLLYLASGWSEAVFPPPTRVLVSLWELVSSGELVGHAVASLFRVTVGYYAAVLLGIPLGMALGWWKTGQVGANALIQFLRPISPLAWIPLAMLWFGIGDAPAVFLIFLSAFFPMLIATITAVNRIERTYFLVAANFRFTRLETFRLVILPAALPNILPAMRIALGIAWLVVVAAEMIAVKSGLGYLILDARNALRMDTVIAAMITIGVIGIGLDRAMSMVERSELMRWRTTRS